ncbi:hypothetical protein BC332_01928 [Capsicum chinense]|nr:hypothetical protein BC332_01928 [Capsicum chinense]
MVLLGTDGIDPELFLVDIVLLGTDGIDMCTDVTDGCVFVMVLICIIVYIRFPGNNLPPQLLPHLYDALFDEISWATEYEHNNADKQKGPSGDQTIVYIKSEDKIFHELSTWSFSFPLHTQLVRTDEEETGDDVLPYGGKEVVFTLSLD